MMNTKKDYKIYIAGEFKETDTALEVINPFDGSPVATTYLGGEADIEEAVARADEVAGELARTLGYKRAEILRGVASALKDRTEEIAKVIALEAGKPITEARAEVSRAASTFLIASEEATRLGGELMALDVIKGAEDRCGIIRRFPVGTVLGISPFNFPLNLVAHKVAPAMAAGCPIIIKPATKTPLTALLLAEIIDEQGYTKGGLSVVPCKASHIEPFVSDDRIKKLTFTGSPAVGWHLKALANKKKVTLELGGNAGVIVDADADIAYAVKRCVAGAFAYAGQVCISVQRIYVHENIFGEFRDKFVAEVKALKVGDQMDELTSVGPMIDKGSLNNIDEWVKDAESKGAELLAGGSIEGACFLPTVLTNTTPDMNVACEEAFAPITILESISSFDEGLGEVNNSSFGLQAGVFTNDLKKIFRAYETLEVGGVIAGDVPTFRVDSMPYGGVKDSGFGREGVKFAIEEMTEPRLLVLSTR
jgi:glyceraldehyde-3-phosphate dehydrogenase (NADP+)